MEQRARMIEREREREREGRARSSREGGLERYNG